MLTAVKKLEFEKAALLRDQISFLKDGKKNLKKQKLVAIQAGKNIGKEKDMVTKIHNLKFLIIILFLFPFFLKGELTSKKIIIFLDKIEVRGSGCLPEKGKRLREVPFMLIHLLSITYKQV